MHTDDDFLAKLLTDPADHSTRLVYADWLDEQSDSVSAAKAEFLRITVQEATQAGKKGGRKSQRKRLQELAATLDTEWLAVVSRLTVENCQGKRAEEESKGVAHLFRFDYLCDRSWDELKPSKKRAVRFCDACKQNVHYCGTIMQARKHAQAGHCVAVDLGLIRRENDLAPPQIWMGRMLPEDVREEEERQRPDPVSAERERRKRGKGK